MFKKYQISCLLCGLLLGVGSHNLLAKDGKITVGASPEPHAIILEKAIAPLKAKGVRLQIQEFTDYVIPNMALDDGSIDANFFQHEPYLKAFNEEKGTKLISIAKIHLEPMGVYATKIKKLADLKQGAVIAIPNDPSNGSRALKILAKEGVIKIKEGELISTHDITENPKNIKFQELDAPQLARILDEVDAAVINTNFALLGNLNPLKDAIAIEAKDSPYANIIVIKPENKDDPDIKALMEALQSDEIRQFILEHYKGSILPSF